jgi:hypothetical protein
MLPTSLSHAPTQNAHYGNNNNQADSYYESPVYSSMVSPFSQGGVTEQNSYFSYEPSGMNSTANSSNLTVGNDNQQPAGNFYPQRSTTQPVAYVSQNGHHHHHHHHHSMQNHYSLPAIHQRTSSHLSTLSSGTPTPPESAISDTNPFNSVNQNSPTYLNTVHDNNQNRSLHYQQQIPANAQQQEQASGFFFLPAQQSDTSSQSENNGKAGGSGILPRRSRALMETGPVFFETVQNQVLRSMDSTLSYVYFLNLSSHGPLFIFF